MPANYRKKRRPDLELLTFAQRGADDSRLCAQLLDWLRHLSATVREEVCADENPWLVIVLKQMLFYKAHSGEAVHSIDKDVEVELFQCELGGSFTSAMRTEREASEKLRAEWRFEENLRVWSVADDWDTLALSSQLASDIDTLLELLSLISDGQAFTVPCRVTWSTALKMWIRESPPWLNSAPNNSLAAFAAASLERTIWLKFWLAKKLNPRRPGENQTFNYEAPRDGYPRARECYVDFWRELDRTKRVEIIGNPPQLAAEYIGGLESLEKLRALSEELQEDEEDVPPTGPLCEDCQRRQTALLQRIKEFNAPKSVDAILQVGTCPDSVGDFIDLLFTSPLDRISSAFDMVARRVGEQLKTAYQQKMAEDLALLEEAEQVKKQGKKNRGEVPDKVTVRKSKFKKKRRLSDVSTVSASTTASAATSLSSKDEEEASECRSLASKLLEAETLPVNPSSKQQIPELPDEDCTDEKEDRLPTNWPLLPSQEKEKKKKKKKKKKTVVKEPQQPPDRLTKDITKYRAEIEKLVEAQESAREEVIALISTVCGRMFPGSSVKLYGSMRTGLALPWSDVDLSIAGTHLSTREEISSAICMLGFNLAAHSWVSAHELIPTAAIPIIKLECQSTAQSVNVDLSFEDERCTGANSSLFCMDSLVQFPVLKDLALVLKSLLHVMGLNRAFQGGLSSYQLFLWVLAFLQSNAPASAGQLLLGFLRHYGLNFDPKATGICTHRQPAFFALEGSYAPVVTLDPVTRDFNTTRCCTLITQILATFARAHSLLMEMQSQKRKKNFIKTLLKSIAEAKC